MRDDERVSALMSPRTTLPRNRQITNDLGASFRERKTTPVLPLHAVVQCYVRQPNLAGSTMSNVTIRSRKICYSRCRRGHRLTIFSELQMIPTARLAYRAHGPCCSRIITTLLQCGILIQAILLRRRPPASLDLLLIR